MKLSLFSISATQGGDLPVTSSSDEEGPPLKDFDGGATQEVAVQPYNEGQETGQVEIQREGDRRSAAGLDNCRSGARGSSAAQAKRN